MKSKLYVITFYVLILQGCWNTKNAVPPNLLGHWHMEEPYSMSLDITDSLVFVNRNSLVGEFETFPLVDSTGAISLPLYCGCGGSLLPVVNKFHLGRRTLTYDNKIADYCYAFTPLTFTKSNPNDCRTKHAFGGYARKVKLLNFPKAYSGVLNFDSLTNNVSLGFVMVGYPTDAKNFGESPKIQVDDVFAEITEMPEYIEAVKR